MTRKGGIVKILGFAVAVALTFAQPAAAFETQNITWDELLPEPRPYHDPFLELEYTQIRDLAELFRIEKTQTPDPSTATGAKALEIREDLVSQGLDPDQLFEQRGIVMNQRKLAATEPNVDLLGKVVRLPGYLLPLEMVDQRAVEFLLVPTVGACIHTPPPPANQMVLVRYEKGFKVDGLFNPVWISGALTAQNRSNSLHLVDGQAEVETTYFVDAMSVDIFQ